MNTEDNLTPSGDGREEPTGQRPQSDPAAEELRLALARERFDEFVDVAARTMLALKRYMQRRGPAAKVAAAFRRMAEVVKAADAGDGAGAGARMTDLWVDYDAVEHGASQGRFTAGLIEAARYMTATGRTWSDRDLFDLVRLAVLHVIS